MPWLLVALGGALGALSRYALDRAVVAAIGPTVLGIMLINVTGSFLLGVFVSASEGFGWPSSARMLIAVGFLGILHDLLDPYGRLSSTRRIR